MKKQKPISADPEDLAQGFAGPIVTDHVGNLLVLCSRELLISSSVFYQDGEQIGYRPSNFYPEVQKHRAASLVGWFEPDQDKLIDPSITLFEVVLDPVEIFEQEVEVATPEGPIPARVVSMNTYAAFDLPWTPGETVVEGLFRLSPLTSTPDFPIGLSGASVSTKDGRLLGMIVGAIEEDALAVPASEIMRAEGLSFPTARRIHSHNEYAADLQSRPSYARVPKAIEAIRTTLGLPLGTTAQAVVEEWVLRGYDPKKPGPTDIGFSPFDQYFENVSDTVDLSLRLADFAIGEIMHEDDGAALGGVLVGLGNYIEENRRLPDDAPKSSFKLVMEG